MSISDLFLFIIKIGNNNFKNTEKGFIIRTGPSSNPKLLNAYSIESLNTDPANQAIHNLLKETMIIAETQPESESRESTPKPETFSEDEKFQPNVPKVSVDISQGTIETHDPKRNSVASSYFDPMTTVTCFKIFALLYFKHQCVTVRS